jgi:hypothetical protein
MYLIFMADHQTISNLCDCFFQTAYRQCMQKKQPEYFSHGQYLAHVNSTSIPSSLGNASQGNENTSSIPPVHCEEPWSNVPENVFPYLWRVVYWTSQCLTW